MASASAGLVPSLAGLAASASLSQDLRPGLMNSVPSGLGACSFAVSATPTDSVRSLTEGGEGARSTPALSSSCSAKVPACIALASSISCWKFFSEDSARGGKSWRRIASPIAPHSDNPVSRARRSRVSMVPLPTPRVGVLITRRREMESSGFWITFRYEIMSLISARS